MRSSLHTLIERVNALEGRGLLGLLLAASPVVAFALLASVVIEGQTRGFDARLLLLFRAADNPSLAIGPAWLKDAMRDITALGSTSVLADAMLACLTSSHPHQAMCGMSTFPTLFR